MFASDNRAAFADHAARPTAAPVDPPVAAAPRSGPVRSRWLLPLSLALGVLIATFGDRLVTHISYAVEKGKIQATADELAESVASVEQLSRAFRMVAKVVRPGVVQLQVSGGEMDAEALRAVRRRLEEQFGHNFTDEEWERFLRERRDQPLGTGSGIVFDADGHILTNNHVVSGRRNIRVRLHDDREFVARVVGTDEKSDLAVLKIDATDVHPLKFGDSDAMEVGDWVLAVGAPFGLAQTVTHGIVSAKGRNDVADVPIFYQDFLQTDAAINPGNSGGPLVNLRGEVIGVNTAIATRGDSQNAGIAFTIPSNMAQRIARQLRSGGRVARGWLGIRLGELGRDDVSILGLPSNRGVLVDALYAGSPGLAAGLQVEDVIIGVGGRETPGLRALQAAIAEVGPAQRTTLRVIRDGAELQLPIVVGEQPDDIEAFGRNAEAVAARTAAGLALAVRSMRPGLPRSLFTALSDQALASRAAEVSEQQGVFVVDYADAGAARDYGVSPGDLVTAVNGTPVASVQQLNAALQRIGQQGVRLQVIGEEGRQRTVYIERP